MVIFFNSRFNNNIKKKIFKNILGLKHLKNIFVLMKRERIS